MDWTPLYITIPADREAVALALYRAGYTVRQQKRKDGNKTVIYIEYRKRDDHV
jgi:hypothetical protein